MKSLEKSSELSRTNFKSKKQNSFAINQPLLIDNKRKNHLIFISFWPTNLTHASEQIKNSMAHSSAQTAVLNLIGCRVNFNPDDPGLGGIGRSNKPTVTGEGWGGVTEGRCGVMGMGGSRLQIKKTTGGTSVESTEVQIYKVRFLITVFFIKLMSHY